MTERPPLRGEIQMPGDKSISHRAVILGALATGTSLLRDINLGHDVVASARIAKQLGAGVEVDRQKHRVKVQGYGWGGLREPDDVLDAGNSGTTLRTMLGVTASALGVFSFTGDRSLRERPMMRVVAPLRSMGAQIEGRSGGALAPITVRGVPLMGVEHRLDVASAQVKTALLLAGLRAEGRTVVIEPGPSRDHTERMLECAGAPIEREGASTVVHGGVEALRPADRVIPGDISSAMFFIVAATVVGGSDLRILRVGLNPTRTGGLEVLERMGAAIELAPSGEAEGEPVGTVRVRAANLTATDIDGSLAPRLVDELPILAVAASLATGTTTITGARELRVKESDRIAAMVDGLTRLGAEVEELDDGMLIRGPGRLGGGVVDSHGDHRVAMAFAIAGLVAEGPVRVRGLESAETSFPGFSAILSSVRS